MGLLIIITCSSLELRGCISATLGEMGTRLRNFMPIGMQATYAVISTCRHSRTGLFHWNEPVMVALPFPHPHTRYIGGIINPQTLITTDYDTCIWTLHACTCSLRSIICTRVYSYPEQLPAYKWSEAGICTSTFLNWYGRLTHPWNSEKILHIAVCIICR